MNKHKTLRVKFKLDCCGILVTNYLKANHARFTTVPIKSFSDHL